MQRKPGEVRGANMALIVLSRYQRYPTIPDNVPVVFKIRLNNSMFDSPIDRFARDFVECRARYVA